MELPIFSSTIREEVETRIFSWKGQQKQTRRQQQEEEEVVVVESRTSSWRQQAQISSREKEESATSCSWWEEGGCRISSWKEEEIALADPTGGEETRIPSA